MKKVIVKICMGFAFLIAIFKYINEVSGGRIHLF